MLIFRGQRLHVQEFRPWVFLYPQFGQSRPYRCFERFFMLWEYADIKRYPRCQTLCRHVFGDQAPYAGIVYQRPCLGREYGVKQVVRYLSRQAGRIPEIVAEPESYGFEQPDLIRNFFA